MALTRHYFKQDGVREKLHCSRLEIDGGAASDGMRKPSAIDARIDKWYNNCESIDARAAP